MDVNTSLDKMANDVLLLVPKKDKLEAREIFFNYKKLLPHLFVADVEQFEKAQEALYEKEAAEEDGKEIETVNTFSRSCWSRWLLKSIPKLST